MSDRPLITMSPEDQRAFAQLAVTGGMILPDALYLVPEVARLIGVPVRRVKRMLDTPGHLLREGLHEDPELERGRQRVRGSAILRYQSSIKVR